MSGLTETELAAQSIHGAQLNRDECEKILTSPALELLPLLDAAFTVRKRFFGKEVAVHVINNAQNGHCPEDCHYCAQAKTSAADIAEYPLKPDREIMAEAKAAYESGAFRYCMVFAGRGPSKRRVDHLARLIKTIKSQYPIQICVSAGLMNEGDARKLKEAGLDRLNHNLNTSERHYPKICTTHTYQDRIQTLKAAQGAGLDICSGVIIGMGEEIADVIDTALTLRKFKVPSIPVNFYIPIEGNPLPKPTNLTPDYCLRVLCLYRFLNPEAEIRVAAGREQHLRGMEVMALYPANSLFMDGYLNTKGTSPQKTLQMIKDAGFSIKSDQKLDALLSREAPPLKDVQDLRPRLKSLSR